MSMVTNNFFEIRSKHLYPFYVGEYPKKTHFLTLGSRSPNCDYGYEQRLCIQIFSKEYLKKVSMWDNDFEKLLMVFKILKFL